MAGDHVESGFHWINRRQVLAGTAAAALAGAWPRAAAAAPAKFRRYEITDPKLPANIIPSYKKAVEAMLHLPPSDPRNWYRQALIHVFDCPHHNWWFLPWHRGYIGWFERICRDLSGDHDFTLPYWDWTKKPSVPMAMFSGVLDPSNKAFLAGYNAFENTFKKPLNALWKSFSPAQLAVLAKRNLATASDFWQGLVFDFPEPKGARVWVSHKSPDLLEFFADATKPEVIKSALQVSRFAGTPDSIGTMGFASAKATNHSDGPGAGILESQPHDMVHSAFAGFMGLQLSPIDPVFYLHHANIDRLWDVWTRRQIALGQATLPKGADLALWSADPFLFFIDEKSKLVGNAKAGDYALMSSFDYDYAPGAGEDMVPVAVAAAPPPPPPGLTIAAKITAPAIAGLARATALAELPAGALRAPVPGAGPRTVTVTLDLSPADRGRRFSVIAARPGGQSQVRLGGIFIFGHVHGRTSFDVPLLDSAIAGLGLVDAPTALEIRVVSQPDARPANGAAMHGMQGGAAQPSLSAVRMNL